MSGYRLTQLGTICFYYNALMGSSALKIPEALSHGTGLGFYADAVLLAFILILALVVANQMIGNMKQANLKRSSELERELLHSNMPRVRLGGPEQPSESSEIRITIYDCCGLMWPSTFVWILFLMSWSCIMVENLLSFATQVATVVPEDSKWIAISISILFLLLIALITEMLNLKTMEKLQIAMAVCRILILILIGISWSVISNLEMENQDSDNLKLLQAKEESTSWMNLCSTVNVMFCGFFLHITLPSIVAVSNTEEQSAMNPIAIIMHYAICLILGCLYPSFPQYASVQLNSLASSDPMLYYLVSFAIQLGPPIIAMLEVNLYWWMCRQLIVNRPGLNNGRGCSTACAMVTKFVFLLYPWLLYTVLIYVFSDHFSINLSWKSGILMSAAGLIYQLVVMGYGRNRGWGIWSICLLLAASAIFHVGIACFFFEIGKL